MFSKDYSFRYGDVDNKFNIKISTVLDILQDISILHSDYVGFSLEKLYSMNIAWLLKGWRIRFLSKLDYNNTTVKTGIMRTNKFESVRKYEIWQNGICKVIATAEWFTVDTQKMSLAKTPPELHEAFESISEQDNNLPFVKLRSEADMTLDAQMTVQPRDIDSNNHVNNVKSAEILLDYVPENENFDEMQITYRKELHKEDIIKIYTKPTEDGFLAELQNQNNETCVILKTTKTDC